MIKVTWEKFKSLLKSIWVWLTSFFETHKHLYVTHNQKYAHMANYKYELKDKKLILK